MIQPLQLKGISALLVATSFLLVLGAVLLDRPQPSLTLIAWAGIQSTATYAGLVWALRRSNTTFFSIFVGDALLRLLTLGAAVYFLHAHNVAFMRPLVSLAMGYLILSLVQIPFLHRLPQ